MHGSHEPRAVLAALALSVIVTTGAAAAAPVGVIRATDGRRECVAPLADGATFHYRYVQSMYEQPVVEDLVRHGDRIAVLRIRSSELRAVEYYRWDTPIRRDGDAYVQEAPPYYVPAQPGGAGRSGDAEHRMTTYETDRLTIRVSPPYAQRIDGAGWSCDLEALFPGEVVTVVPETRLALATLR